MKPSPCAPVILTPSTLHAFLHATSFLRCTTPYALCPTPYTLNLTPQTLFPTPQTLNPKPRTPHPKLSTLATRFPLDEMLLMLNRLNETDRFPLDEMLLMDFSTDHLKGDTELIGGELGHIPTFLYAFPFDKKTVFLQVSSDPL